MTTQTLMRIIGFAPAAAGSRLWLVGISCRWKPWREVLFGWVTLAEVVEELDHRGDPISERETGYRSIHPGWLADGQIVTTEHLYGDGLEVWPIAHGEPDPTPQELADWAESIRAERAELEAIRKQRTGQKAQLS